MHFLKPLPRSRRQEGRLIDMSVLALILTCYASGIALTGGLALLALARAIMAKEHCSMVESFEKFGVYFDRDSADKDLRKRRAYDRTAIMLFLLTEGVALIFKVVVFGMALAAA